MMSTTTTKRPMRHGRPTVAWAKSIYGWCGFLESENSRLESEVERLRAHLKRLKLVLTQG